MILRVSDKDIVDISKIGYITLDGQKIIFGDVNNYDFYYTPEGKHPFEMMKLERSLYEK